MLRGCYQEQSQVIDFLLMVSGAFFAMIVSGIINYKKSVWIGLTDDDWDYIFGNALTIGEAIKVTEAKLKEKNS